MVLFEVLMVVGVKESSFLNKIFTGLNVAVIMFIVFSGMLKTKVANWQVHPYVKFALFLKKSIFSFCYYNPFSFAAEFELDRF